MLSIDLLLQEGTQRLQASNVDSPAFDARELLLFAAGLSRPADLLTHKCVDEDAANRYWDLVSQREQRYPLQYILGFWEFYGRTFSVREGVLIPRPDTERLIDVALSLPLPSSPSVLDLCSGSGILAITLALELQTTADAVELSSEAFPVLQENIRRYPAKVTPIHADICTWSPAHAYDLIVSNPPYIRISELSLLQPEVHFEPEMALAAGQDGLFFYHTIIRRYVNVLLPGGWLVFEAGIGQAGDIANAMSSFGLEHITITKDYGGIERVIAGQKQS